MLEHLRFTCGSFLLDPDAPLDIAWHKKLMEGGTALLYVRNGLRCIDPVENVVYSSPILGISPNICCWCAMEVGPENGLEDFVAHKNLNQERSVLPCCSATQCKALGFISRKTKRVNQITLKEKKKCKKKARKNAAASSSLTASSSLKCCIICVESDPPIMRLCNVCKVSSVHHMCSIAKFKLDDTTESFCSQACFDDA